MNNPKTNDASASDSRTPNTPNPLLQPEHEGDAGTVPAAAESDGGIADEHNDFEPEETFASSASEPQIPNTRIPMTRSADAGTLPTVPEIEGDDAEEYNERDPEGQTQPAEAGQEKFPNKQ